MNLELAIAADDSEVCVLRGGEVAADVSFEFVMTKEVSLLDGIVQSFVVLQIVEGLVCHRAYLGPQSVEKGSHDM